MIDMAQFVYPAGALIHLLHPVQVKLLAE